MKIQGLNKWLCNIFYFQFACTRHSELEGCLLPSNQIQLFYSYLGNLHQHYSYSIDCKEVHHSSSVRREEELAEVYTIL